MEQSFDWSSTSQPVVRDQSWTQVHVCQIGKTLVVRDHHVTDRRLMAYAAAINALESVYLDDAREERLIAAPGYNSVYEWPLLIDRAYLKAIDVPEERLFFHLLHAFQDTYIHAPIRSGQHLRSSLIIANVRQIRAGCLIVNHIRTEDVRTGGLVSETWFGSLLRGLANVGEELKAGHEPELPSWDGSQDDVLSSHRIDIPKGLAHVYSECSGIWNPLHTERRLAIASGYQDIILHGTCTWAMACLHLVRTCGGSDPTSLRRFGARFAGPITPGTNVILKWGSASKGCAIGFDVRQDDGRRVLSHGIAVLETRGE